MKSHRPFPLALMALLLCVDVGVIFCYKQSALNHLNSAEQFYQQLLSEPFLWAGLLFSVLQLVTWTKILERVSLGQAYLVASLNYPLAMFLAVSVFHEKLPWITWCGVLLVMSGVMIVGVSHQQPQIISESK